MCSPNIKFQVLIGPAAPIRPPCLVPVSPRWSQASRPRRARLGPKSPSAERIWAPARRTSLVIFFYFFITSRLTTNIKKKKPKTNVVHSVKVFIFFFLIFFFPLPPQIHALKWICYNSHESWNTSDFDTLSLGDNSGVFFANVWRT